MLQRLVLQDHSDFDYDLVTLLALGFESLVGFEIVRACAGLPAMVHLCRSSSPCLYEEQWLSDRFVRMVVVEQQPQAVTNLSSGRQWLCGDKISEKCM